MSHDCNCRNNLDIRIQTTWPSFCRCNFQMLSGDHYIMIWHFTGVICGGFNWLLCLFQCITYSVLTSLELVMSSFGECPPQTTTNQTRVFLIVSHWAIKDVICFKPSHPSEQTRVVPRNILSIRLCKQFRWLRTSLSPCTVINPISLTYSVRWHRSLSLIKGGWIWISTHIHHSHRLEGWYDNSINERY